MRILWIENYQHCCFCNHDLMHFSILRVSVNSLDDCYSAIVDSFIFIHSLMSSQLFLSLKGYCVYMIKKQYMVAYRYGIFLLMFNSTSHSFAVLTHELSSQTLEEKFHIYTCPCIILYILSTSSVLVMAVNYCNIYQQAWGWFSGEYPHWRNESRRYMHNTLVCTYRHYLHHIVYSLSKFSCNRYFCSSTNVRLL